MKIRKIQAPTMPEAMKKVRKELGADAVILNSKNIKTGGFLGFFKREQTEVIAAIDPEDQKKQGSELEVNMPPSKDGDAIVKEIRQMKELLLKKDSHYPPLYQHAYEYLISKEVETDLAGYFVDALLEKYEQTEDTEVLKQRLTNEIYDHLKGLSFGKSTFSKPFVHLVGPTGVGKTTTLAKLAADAILHRQQKVGFITTDTYRIAAVDQLKTYATILNVPLEVAYNADDFKAAREKFADYDLVFVDTAGRNFRDAAYVEELKDLIDFDNDSENFLVLSLTSKLVDMKAVYKEFKDLPVDQLIFTKMDETVHIGSAVNMASSTGKGIAYFTNGQDVPDDRKEASPMYLARLLMEGFAHE